MIKKEILNKSLNNILIKDKFFKKKIIKNENFYKKLIKKNEYDLIINSDQNNYISKKYFVKKIDKDYKNFAHTTVIEHEKLDNNSAIQVFTDLGPIAFLPISNIKTSVVLSLDIKKKNIVIKKY